MVKEKTGRVMQTKERTVTDKKTGKTKVVNGSSPLRESVVVCKQNTTIDQLRKYCDRCHERWGITALQIFIHQDEGHYGIPGDNSTWKPNSHAHIVWDWMNHETGKSCKLGKVDMSLMQDMVAECLEMERGTRKQETGNEHLERTDFIIAKQKQEMEEAANKKKHLEHENQVREKIGAELDEEIARKQDKANRENGNAILSSAAKLLGKGKYADMEKENTALKERLAGMVHKMKAMGQELYTIWLPSPLIPVQVCEYPTVIISCYGGVLFLLLLRCSRIAAIRNEVQRLILEDRLRLRLWDVVRFHNLFVYTICACAGLEPAARTQTVHAFTNSENKVSLSNSIVAVRPA